MERHPRGKMRGGFAEHHKAPDFPGSHGTETAHSTPVAGHSTGGGVSFGHAEHHQRAGEDNPHIVGHAKQPGGKSIGAAEHHRGSTFGGETHRFRGTHGGSVLRHSGDSSAHQIGCKKR